MSPRGGKRIGAGRPKERTEPLVALNLRIEPKLFAAFWRKAGALSGPTFLAKLLNWKPAKAARANGQKGGRPVKGTKV